MCAVQLRQGEMRAAQLQSQMEQTDRELKEEGRMQDRELGEWRNRYHTTSAGLRLKEAELEELQRTRDMALRSLCLQEERNHSLVAQKQGLQHSLGELQERVRGRGWRGIWGCTELRWGQGGTGPTSGHGPFPDRVEV